MTVSDLDLTDVFQTLGKLGLLELTLVIEGQSELVRCSCGLSPEHEARRLRTSLLGSSKGN